MPAAFLNFKMESSFLLYEHQMVAAHREAFPDHRVYHWTDAPEMVLFKAGWIKSFGEHRRRRLEKRKEGVTNPYTEFGLDGVAVDPEDTAHGLQAKSGMRLSFEDFATFFCVASRMNDEDKKSFSYLYHRRHVKFATVVRNMLRDMSFLRSFPMEPSLLGLEDIPPAAAAAGAGAVLEEAPHPTEAVLREYQSEAVDILEEWETGIATLQLPCGDGKTLVATTHVNLNLHKYNRIVILSPLRILAAELLERFIPWVQDAEYTCALVDSDAKGTRDVEEVRRIFQAGKCLMSATYKSADDVIREVVEEEDLEDTLLIVDEVHNLLGNPAEDLLEVFPKALLMSATIPAELFESYEVSVQIKRTMAEAIAEGTVVDYEVYFPLLTDKDDGTKTVSLDFPEDMPDRLDRELSAKALFLATGMLRTGSRRCIVFLRTQEECALFLQVMKWVAEEYHGLGFWGFEIIADTPQDRREAILREFQEDASPETGIVLRIITSVRILDEGVDVVRCDSTFLTSVGEATSDIRTIQRAMRACRVDATNPTKKNACFLWTEDISSCVSALSLLKENDVDFAKKIRTISASYDSTDASSSEEKTQEERTVTFVQSVGVSCLGWEEYHMIRARNFIAFVADNGRFPKNRKDGEKKLAAWLGNFRVCADKHPDVVMYMNANIPEWNDVRRTAPHLDAMTRAREFVAFVATNNRFPRRCIASVEEGEARLASWQYELRSRANVRPDVAAYMDEHVPGWNRTSKASPVDHMTWSHEFVAFTTINGRFPKASKEDEDRLVKWLRRFRNLKAKNPDVAAYMDEKVPGWDVRHRSDPMTRAKQFANFVAIHGRFPKHDTDIESWLARWLSSFRKRVDEHPDVVLFMNDNVPTWRTDRRRRPVD